MSFEICFVFDQTRFPRELQLREVSSLTAVCCAGVTCRTKEWIKHWTSGTCAYNQFDCLSAFFFHTCLFNSLQEFGMARRMISFSHSLMNWVVTSKARRAKKGVNSIPNQATHFFVSVALKYCSSRNPHIEPIVYIYVYICIYNASVYILYKFIFINFLPCSAQN